MQIVIDSSEYEQYCDQIIRLENVNGITEEAK